MSILSPSYPGCGSAYGQTGSNNSVRARRAVTVKPDPGGHATAPIRVASQGDTH